MQLITPTFVLAAPSALAFPFVVAMLGVDSLLLRKMKRVSNYKKHSSCPFNPVHLDAAPYTAKYSYTGAQDSGSAAGDTAHAIEAPGPNDIRGRCPELDTAANHHVSRSLNGISLSLNLFSS